MVQMVDTDAAADLREKLVAELLAQEKIVSEAVETAFRRVPRQQFMPTDTELAAAYGYDNSVVTKRDDRDRALSSVSAAYIQAAMLEMAQLRHGMTVLEIGSGGLNAAYIAEIVGPEGRVVSIDIDPEIIDRAATALDATGYGSRVRALVADAEHGVPGEGPFDAIIVTVGAWDVAPAWLTQLRPEGVLVLPLVMNNVTRVIAFRRDGEHLVSTAAEVAGFVAMQGDGARADQIIELPGPAGGTVRLSFDSRAPSDLGQLDGVLTAGATESWSQVTVAKGVSFADLHLWFACYLDGFCRLSADSETDVATPKRWLPLAAVRGAGLAYLILRDAPGGAEFGARAYGRDGQLAADALNEQVQAWHRSGRHTTPTFAYWPTGPDIPTDAAAMTKTHGVLTITWPTGS